MNIPKEATVLSEFRCPKYPDMGKITYRICLGRQLARTPGQGWLYRECAECVEGKDVLVRFQDYKPEKKQKPNWNTTGCAKNTEKKRKTTVEVDCVKCKALLQGQIEYAIQLIYQEKQKKAIERLEMILEEI